MRLHPFFVRATIVACGIGILIAGAAAFLLYETNEFFSLRAAAHSQEDLLVGSAFNQETTCYKLARARHLKPGLIFLGSSRVMQFRDVMTPGIVSYNFGGAATSLNTALASMQSLYQTHVPKIVILGIDPWWLDPRRARPQRADWLQRCFENDLRITLANLSAKVIDPRFWKLVFFGNARHGIEPVAGRVPRGLLASTYGSGFRPDGSYQYGRILQNTHPYYDQRGFGHKNGFRHYVTQAKLLKGRLGYTGPIEDRQRTELRSLIQLTKNHGTRLVLFLPPFANAVYEVLDDVPQQADFFKRMREFVLSEAHANDVEFYDFQNLAELGVGDQHTFDGIHADEIAHLKMIDHMSKKGTALYELIDRDALRKMMDSKLDRDGRFHFNLIAR